MKALLDDPRITKPIAAAKEALDKVNFQIMQDITNPDNKDTVGPTLLAIKHISDIYTLFALKGKVVATENKTNA